MNICFIAPYEEMSVLATEVAAEEVLNVDVIVADFNEIPALLLTLETEKYSAFVSRGATAGHLKQKLSIPVFEVGTSGYDIVSTCSEFIGTELRIAVVGHKNVINDLLHISPMLKMQIFPFVIGGANGSGGKMLLAELERFVRTNAIDITVGDTVYRSDFDKLGFEYRLLRSGKAAIRDALLAAQSFVTLLDEKRKRSQHLETVLELVDHAVLSTTADGVISTVNRAAAKLLGCSIVDLVGQNLSAVDPLLAVDMTMADELTDRARIVDTQFGKLIMGQAALEVGRKHHSIVVTLQKYEDIADIDQLVRRKELEGRGLVAGYSFDDFITQNPGMERVIERQKRYAITEATVLIYGESGTGKEIIAQSIHNASPRREHPFVAVNCGALPGELLESELFGYVEGAFTGANRKGKKGLFELAHNGTIFLDEISELALHLQSRLLRVIQERQVMRLGSDKVIPVNIRIVAATNRNIKDRVADGEFREDLYYRLNVLSANLLPLRQRPEDILPIAYGMLKNNRQRYNHPLKDFDQELKSRLHQFDWPGNARQLANIMERLCLTVESETAHYAEVEFLLDELNEPGSPETDQTCDQCPLLEGAYSDIRKRILQKMLTGAGGNKSQLAEELGIDRGTMYRWLK